MRFFLSLVLLAVVGAGASAAGLWALGSALSAPAARAVGEPPASLGAREVEFASESGSPIRGWFAPGEPGQGAVVLAHAVRSNRLGLVGRAEFLRRAGYSVLLFDAQAHGESPGSRITFGYLEALDTRAAVALVRSELPGERIGYLGVSQGGAAALLGPGPLEVSALVLEAVYPTLRAALENRIAIRLGPFARLLAPLLLVQVEPRLGVPASRLAPIEGIRDLRAPVLLIAGARDRDTTLSDSERLFEAAREPKQLWVLPGAAHQNFYRSNRSEYERRVLEFFGRFLRDQAA